MIIHQSLPLRSATVPPVKLGDMDPATLTDAQLSEIAEIMEADQLPLAHSALIALALEAGANGLVKVEKNVQLAAGVGPGTHAVVAVRGVPVLAGLKEAGVVGAGWSGQGQGQGQGQASGWGGGGQSQGDGWGGGGAGSGAGQWGGDGAGHGGGWGDLAEDNSGGRVNGVVGGTGQGGWGGGHGDEWGGTNGASGGGWGNASKPHAGWGA